MLEGLYTAAAGMAAQQERLDALSNDVANSNTTGYKHVRVGFYDLLYQPDGPGAGAVRTGSGAAAVDVGRGFEQGSLQQTQQPFDLAIVGQGYFQVRLPTGQTALTRDGSFRLDASRQLVTATGARLVPPIRVPAGVDDKSVSIAANGTVSIRGRTIGRITVVDVPSPTGLVAAGDSYFLPGAASGPVGRAAGARIEQGSLEGSDVNLADTMVDMMDSERSYSMASKAIQMQDQIMQIANQVKQ
jgi:flagellar basal-body rod protein FlgG